MTAYFEQLAQDAYLLASKHGPSDEQEKIKEEEQKVIQYIPNAID